VVVRVIGWVDVWVSVSLSPSRRRSRQTSTEEYIRVLCSLDAPALTPTLVRELVEPPAAVAAGDAASRPIFNVALAGHARSAARAWASVRKISLMTDEVCLNVFVSLRGCSGIPSRPTG
jgi:hypothetical protein